MIPMPTPRLPFHRSMKGRAVSIVVVTGLMIVSADNGGVMAGNNWPWRGEKLTAWEGGTRVAAFVTGGSEIHGNTRSHSNKRASFNGTNSCQQVFLITRNNRSILSIELDIKRCF